MDFISAGEITQLTKKILSLSNPSDKCLIFTLKKQSIYFRNRTSYNIHKIIYKDQNPSFDLCSTQVAHLTCNNRKCVNISHLSFDRQYKDDKISVYKRLNKHVTIDGECIISLRCGNSKQGYGKVTLNGKTHSLHKVVYWIFSDIVDINDIQNTKKTGLVVRHKCRNLNCLNGEHYELGTTYDNKNDMIRDGTQKYGENHHSAKMTLQTAQAIADSWRPTDSPEYKTKKFRGDLFGVSEGVVNSIDRRNTWHMIRHPNGQEPKKQNWKTSFKSVYVTNDQWSTLWEKLRERSYDDVIDNTFCKSPCWFWKNSIQSKPRICFLSRSKYASIWAAEYTAKRLKQDHEEARHLCGNGKLNCVNPSHLALGTKTENEQDKRIHGTAGSKLTLKDAVFIRNTKQSAREIAKKFNISAEHVWQIRKGNVWKEVDA